MPSRAKRVMVERALHGGALVTLGVLVLGTLTAPAQRGREEQAAAAVPRWIASAEAETLVVQGDAVPDPTTRDLLVALRRNAHVVAWGAGGAVPSALELEPVADPRGGAVVRVAAPTGASVAVGDELGQVHETVVRRSGATFRVPEPAGMTWAHIQGDTTARATVGTRTVRSVVVLGRAGWEARFVMAALEERGWSVAARLALAPGLSFIQGAPLPLDTARHAAVVVLDTTAADEATRIARFVWAGGGLVVSGAGGDALDWRFGDRVRPQSLQIRVERPLEGMSYRPVAFRAGIVPLARANQDIVIAARRVGAGRVVQVGYEDTWRWRMAGEGDAPRAHAAWWSDLVSAAAMKTVAPTGRSAVAPFAEAVAALGVPSVFRDREKSRRPVLWPWLLVFAISTMFGEWASRRLRGAS